MKAYRVTLVIIDTDELGPDEIRAVIENVRWPNHCIDPAVVRIEGANVGEWDDDHPLNQRGADLEAPFRIAGPSVTFLRSEADRYLREADEHLQSHGSRESKSVREKKRAQARALTRAADALSARAAED